MTRYLFFITLTGLLQMCISLDSCINGSPNCVDVTLNEMRDRRNFMIFNQSCDHNAVFLTFYQYMTEHYEKNSTTVAANGSRIFSDSFLNAAWMARIDRVFANYYFDQRDRWTSGELDLVPEAWKIAFEAADKRELLALGDALLGINAHINRDLPYVIASLINANETSNKTDYDYVNGILFDAMDAVIHAVENEFDASIGKIYNRLTKYLSFEVIKRWRETAWSNALKLTNASPYPFDYGLVKADIESEATLLANTIRLLAQTDSSARDSYCRRVHGLAMLVE